MNSSGAKILIVDDEDSVRSACKKILEAQGFEIFEANTGGAALKMMEQENIDVVLLDVILPDCSGVDILPEIKNRFGDLQVIVMTAFGSIDLAIKSLKNGAYDFLTKPFADFEAISHTVGEAYEKKRLIEKTRRLENALFDKYSFSNIVGASREMKKVFTAIQDVAYSSSTVLVQGDSGTGKELVAKAIHYNSPRKNKELVAFNCSALTGSLIDSELFGHVKGSFTGAIGDKMGLFEAANNSTIFLDEIGDMPLESQIRLLRVLQEGELKPVGSNSSKKVNVRVIAASNRNLKELVEQKKFREDLYYRLSVIVINLPSLSSRKEDIPILAYYFLKKYNEKNQKNIKHISPEVMQILESYNWEGNVRELENVIERGVVIAKGDVINLKDLPSNMVSSNSFFGKSEDSPQAPELMKLSFKEAKNQIVESFAKSYFSSLLVESEGNITRAAVQADIERSNLKKLLKKYDVKTYSFKD